MIRPRGEEMHTWLLTWLTERASDVLPRAKGIAAQCPGVASVYSIDAALRHLAGKGAITRRTGTVSENRGHAAIRIVATGRVLKTPGCPFEPPDA